MPPVNGGRHPKGMGASRKKMPKFQWTQVDVLQQTFREINNKNNEHDSKWAPLKLSLRNTVDMEHLHQ